ncbi:MAG: malate dehydrogenase (quinone) [Saprospiraceae bacterium]|jgi:malate dehydrogenase (quinone)
MSKSETEIALIGAGIMSATLGVMLKRLMPDAKISIFERLDKVGAESSDAWNNAGTGHSAFCELNYSPFREDGSVDLTKALRIAEQFEVSKQFWSHLKESGHLPNQQPFINDIPHMSFVWGNENVKFLKERYFSMTAYPIFHDMEYTEERPYRDLGTTDDVWSKR